jgi:hypothetical protein
MMQVTKACVQTAIRSSDSTSECRTIDETADKNPFLQKFFNKIPQSCRCLSISHRRNLLAKTVSMPVQGSGGSFGPS